MNNFILSRSLKEIHRAVGLSLEERGDKLVLVKGRRDIKEIDERDPFEKIIEAADDYVIQLQMPIVQAIKDRINGKIDLELHTVDVTAEMFGGEIARSNEAARRNYVAAWYEVLDIIEEVVSAKPATP